MAAAAAVLGRKGYANTSLKDVAAEAGIAPGLLHYYFQSKDDLLVEVVAEVDRQLQQEWAEGAAGIEDPMARINAGIDRAIRNCSEKPEFFRLLLDAYALGLDNPNIGARTQEMLDNFTNLIRAEMLAMQDRLPLPVPENDDVFDFPGAIAGAINGIAWLSLVRGKSSASAYNAFRMYILGLTAVGYMAAGQELPPELTKQMMEAGGGVFPTEPAP